MNRARAELKAFANRTKERATEVLLTAEEQAEATAAELRELGRVAGKKIAAATAAAKKALK